MGANNLYFPSVQDAYRFGSKGVFTIINDTKTGLPLKISIDKFFEQAYNLGYISNELTADELAAINGANNPNAGNVFATMQDIPTNVSELNNDAGYITSAPNFATDDLDFTGPRVHDALGNDLTISNLAIQTENFVFSNYSGYKDLTNSNGNVLMRHFSNGELHYDAHLGSAGETIKHTSGRWDLPNTVTINKPNFDANTLVNIKAQSSSGLNVAVGIRSFTDTFYLHQTLANGEFKNQTTAGYIFDWWDYGNGFPAFTMEAPNGGQLQQRFRYNGVNKASFALNSSGNKFNMNTQDNVLFEMRHVVDFVSNNVHVQKTVDGEWLFTNDPTSLQTPETGVRAKFYGTVKTVAPGNLAADVAFNIRNSAETQDIFKVLGNSQFGVNNTNVNSQFHIENSVFAWGFSVFQNKAFEDAIYISSVSGRGGYFTSDSAVGVQGVNVNGANYGVVALGKSDGTGKALRASGEVKFVSPSVSSLDTAFGVRNFADTAWMFHIAANGNGEYLSGNHSFGDVVNPNAKLQGVTNAVGVVALRGYHYGSGGEAIVGLADGANAVGVQGTAQGFGAEGVKGTGFYGGSFTGSDASGYAIHGLSHNNGAGNAALLKGTVRIISPSASGLDTTLGVRTFGDTAWYLRGLGNGTFIFTSDTAQQADAIQASTDGAFADKYPGVFTNNCIATGSKPAIRAVSQGAGANSENYGVFGIAQNGLAVNTGVRGQGFGAVGILGNGVYGSTESGWGAGGYFTAPSGHAEAFATITTTKNLHKKFTNATGLPAVNNMDGQFGAGVMSGVIVVESTTGLTIAISNGTNWIDIRTGVAVVI